MSDVVDKLSNEIDKLSELKEYIEKLESSASKAQFQNIDWYDVEIGVGDLEVVTRLFRPVKVFIKNTSKCNKCNGGFIKVTNDFANEYNVCDCLFDKSWYVVKKIPIHSIIKYKDSTMYVAYDPDTTEKFIPDENVLNDNYYTIREYKVGFYCTDYDAVDKFCREMNGE